MTLVKPAKARRIVQIGCLISLAPAGKSKVVGGAPPGAGTRLRPGLRPVNDTARTMFRGTMQNRFYDRACSWPRLIVGLALAALIGGCAGSGASGRAPSATASPTPVAASSSLAFDAGRVASQQPALLKAALDRLVPEQPGRTDLYFVGFAGDAQEDVFLHEAEAAQAVLDRRFGTSGRSLLLANNPKTVDRLPLASIENLSGALAGIGARMDRDEDVLFLFLTSHGREGGWLSTRFDPFRPRAFVARQLDAALDDAGIKWRVIVISACFSGAFIEPLADENSLIITAARADRTSFGCGHDGQFTYFGEAYFGRALPDTRSFVAAYDSARALVSQWERARGFTPSLPQIHVGGAIEAKLAEIEGPAQSAAME